MGSPFARIVSEMITALVTVVEEKDVHFRGHSERVAGNSVLLARKLGLTKREIEQVYLAGRLHDVGMVYIPAEIIHKPDQLSDSERVLFEQHPELAEKIISQISIFQELLPLIRHHHEAYDGSGYPDRLKGDRIPVGARILALADAYDTMTSSLPNRPALSAVDAMRVINRNQEGKFDPRMISPFIEVVKANSAPAESAANGDTDVVTEAVKRILTKYKKGEIELPILPNIVEQVRATIDQPNSNADTLAKVLEVDAVISVRIITVANSVVYRGREKVLTVREAVPRLGNKETESIVMAIVNRSLYQTDAQNLAGLMESLWSHSLATAFACKRIAEHLKLPEPERLFTMGLVHDIGKVPLLQTISRLRGAGDKFMEKLEHSVIIKVLQRGHVNLGATLMKNWEFSDEFVRVAQQHENPTFSEHTDKTVMVVHLANMLTRAIGYSLYADEELDLASLDSARLLGLDSSTLRELAQEVKKMVQSSVSSF